ncbi:MAG: diacylglycerol kinase family lipid kinase [Clostridia bacterium]
MRHIILVNPVSGNKKGEKYGITIQKLLKKYKIDAELIKSEYSKQLTQIARKYSSQETCRFYSVGGDGTLNEIVTGIIGSDSEIVVIPCGTGNDFVKSISSYRSLRKIVICSIGTASKKVDVLKVGKDKYCVNILSVGFDSIVSKNLNKFRNVPFVSGKMKYNLAIFYSLVTNKNFKMKLRLDDKIYKQNFTLIAFANGKYYGGGISPCPAASIFDGDIDVCAIDSTTVFKKIIFLPFYSKGKHMKFKLVHIDKTKKATIVSTKKFPANIDGEFFYTNKLSLTILKKALNIVCIDKLK